jgi:hypothetical protein
VGRGFQAKVDLCQSLSWHHADIPEATKVRLRTEHAQLDPFELKKRIEAKLKVFFTALGNLNREATKP